MTSARPKLPRLTEDSEPVLKLRQLVDSGKIKPNARPADVRKMDPLFMAYGANRFRSCFHRVMRDYPEFRDDAEEQELAQRLNRCSDGGPPLKKRRNLEVDSEDEDLSIEKWEGSAHSKLDSTAFSPIHIISQWKQPKSVESRITIAVVLPSGVDAKDFWVNVSEDGMALEITLLWPLAMCDPSVLLRSWLNPEKEGGFVDYHPKILGFQDSLKKLRSSPSERVKCFSRIQLPHAVLPHVVEEVSKSLSVEGVQTICNVLYVELTGVADKYATRERPKGFESG